MAQRTMRGLLPLVLSILLATTFAQAGKSHGSVAETAEIKKDEANRRTLLGGQGYWSTKGSKIVDQNGDAVYFSGLNWGGFEAQNCIVDGLWPGAVSPGVGRSYQSMLKQMAGLGFNLIRLAFAGDCVQDTTYPASGSIDFTMNPDLNGKSVLECMKLIVEGAASVNMKVILDYHRVQKSDSSGRPEAGLWYSASYPVSHWLNTWSSMATYFQNDINVIGVDLFNEVHDDSSHPGPFWNGNASDPYDWKSAAQNAANVIQAIQPGWLICVQGMYYNGSWWGANLTPMIDSPLNLTFSNKLVYEIHDYGPLVSANQWWYNDTTFPANLPSYWDTTWGFMHNNGIAPVWIGEFGTIHNTTYVAKNATLGSPAFVNWQELSWFNTLVSYIQENKLVWTWFTWGPNTRDTGGMLQNDWQTIHYDKWTAIQPIMYPQFGLSTSSSGVASDAPPAVLAPIGVYFISSPPVDPLPPPPPFAWFSAASPSRNLPSSTLVATIILALAVAMAVSSSGLCY